MTIRELAESIFAENPTRFKGKEKEALLEKSRTFLCENGWQPSEVKVQRFKGSFSTKNLVIGDPKTAEYIITAHYDTPGCNGFMLGSSKLLGQTGANILLVLLMLPFCSLGGVMGNLAGSIAGGSERSMEEIMGVSLSMLALIIFMLVMFIPMFIKNKNNRNDNTSGVLTVLGCAVAAAKDPALKGKCCFVLFDNEEWGLIGSAQFAKWCKKQGIELGDKTNINIDCVGVGDYLYAARTNNKKTERQIDLIKRLTAEGLEIKEKQSGMVYMSDHANLKNSYMLCYMDKSAIGAPYIPNIHSGKDTVCDLDKVENLTEKIVSAVS